MILCILTFSLGLEMSCQYGVSGGIDWGFGYNNEQICYIADQAMLQPAKIQADANASSIVVLNMRNKEVKHLPMAMSTTFENLREIDFADCSISSVADQFRGLFELISLTLANNLIETIPNDAFQDNTKLEKIYLDRNKLTAIGGQFRETRNLKLIILAENEISVIEPLAFSNLDKLEEMGLSDNKLTTLAANFFGNHRKLQKLWLDENALEVIDYGIFEKMPNLRRVGLEENKCVDRSYYSDQMSRMRNDVWNNCRANKNN